MVQNITLATTIALLLFLFSGLASANLNNGLVAYYPFNGNANDESGNGNHGTVQGATLDSDRKGNLNSSYYFDGNADAIQIPYNAMNSLSDFTFSLWIKTSKNYGTFISGYSPSNYDEFYLGFYYTDGIKIVIKNNYFEHLVTINDDVWHHISVVRDGSNGIIKVYIDGLQENSTTLKDGALIIDQNGLWIGRMQRCVAGCWTTAYDFNGNIDDIYIHNRKLSSSEVYSLYSGNLTQATPSISVTPASHDFSTVPVGVISTANTFTISNTGTGDLQIGAISVTGSHSQEFVILNDNCSGQSMPSSGICNLDTYFIPVSQGSKSAYIEVPSNDPANPILAVSLKGEGTTQQQFKLTVIRIGSGTITSADGGINCGSDCIESYNGGSNITLTATPDTGYYFDYWAGIGGCAGLSTNPCITTLNQDVILVAIFNPLLTTTPTPTPEETPIPDETPLPDENIKF